MPFIRLSDNYIDHPKFTALTDGSFRLWHEGMAFARRHQTDGLITFRDMKRFQSYTKSREKQLSTPHQDGARPLWTLVPATGYAIHDYLDWNPSKDEENERRADSKDRMRHMRERRQHPGTAPVTPFVTPSPQRVTNANVLDMDTDRDRNLGKEEKVSPPKVRHWQGSGAMGSDLPRAHLRHSVCGRVCLQEQQFGRFVLKFGGEQVAAIKAVEDWANSVLTAWATPPLLDQPIGGNDFQFWDARWEEWRGGSPKVAPRSTIEADAAAVTALLKKQGAML